ncbi:amylosucrase [Roseivirga misakiensis]|uniref:Alpha-amylase n=1 Tax=Roseivirga misakiensis TaxID=1563681 RepID=A0A1E5T6D0_9BACT|nr:amylosucrase [Roseivirga misakiensis]OEK06906.1 alpha-amylase [Roseivirga misakiensis]
MYHPTAHLLLKKLLPELKKAAGDQSIADFERRYVALFSDIYDRFHQLYGQHPDAVEAFEKLSQVLLNGFLKRPSYLKKSDLERETNPAWFRSQEINGMMLYVDRFNKDLKGLSEKVGYFEELGINFLHLMPVLESPKVKNDGGYAVSNYRKIDRRFGTNADFKKTAKTLRDRGTILMLDLVVNHTSDEHEWAVKAKSGDQKYQDFYYAFEDRSIPYMYERSMPEVFPESAPGNFTFNEEMQKWVMTVFNTYQWDLNYTNPHVLVEMLDVILHLANMGVDVFRMDAVAFVWKQIGTACQNLPQAHLIHQLFKLCTQIAAPGVAFLAEAIVAPTEIVKYFGQSKVWSNEHDIAYNATLMALLWNSLATRSTRVMKASLRDVPAKPNGTTWINYARCHDDIGMGFEDRHIQEAGFDAGAHRQFLTKFLTGDFHGSFAKGLPFMYNPKTGDARISGAMASLAGLEQALEEDNKLGIRRAIDRINLMHSIILSYGGIPVIYAGDEIATLNDYSFLKDDAKSDDNRWMHRPEMDWKKSKKRNTKKSVEFEVFQSLKKMIAVRKTVAEFADHNNTHLIEVSNDHVFAFERKFESKSTFVVANFKDSDQEIYPHLVFPQTGVNPFKMVDRITGKSVKAVEGKIMLKPYQYYWLTNK